MTKTHDELTPNYVGRTVHVVTEDGCREAVIRDLSESTSVLYFDTGWSGFDRAREFVGSWHYADHGEWRDQ